MKLSLLTFSFMGDVLTRRMDAETLCRMAKENVIEELDLQEAELRLYGIKAAVKRFEEDVLNVKGAGAVLFAPGVNDLNMARSKKAVSGKAEAILSTLEDLAAREKALADLCILTRSFRIP